MDNLVGRIIRFLISKAFIINFVLALGVATVLVFGSFHMLHSYTNHDTTIEIPDYLGVHINDLDSLTEKDGLRYKIVDEIFLDGYKKGTVVKQDPQPHFRNYEYRISPYPYKLRDSIGSEAKPGRSIYVTVISSKVQMKAVPDLIDKSRKYAQTQLDITGFKYDIVYKPYEACNNCVINVLHKDKPIVAGQKIAKGSLITLVLGQGKSALPTPLLDFYCLTMDEVNNKLQSSTLVINVEFAECENRIDSVNARVAVQRPSLVDIPSGMVPGGKEIRLKLIKDFNCEKKDSTSTMGVSAGENL